MLIPFSDVPRNRGVIFDSQFAKIARTGEQTLSACLSENQADRFNPILKPPKLSFSLMFSLGFIIVKVFLLLTFSFLEGSIAR